MSRCPIPGGTHRRSGPVVAAIRTAIASESVGESLDTGAHDPFPRAVSETGGDEDTGRTARTDAPGGNLETKIYFQLRITRVATDAFLHEEVNCLAI